MAAWAGDGCDNLGSDLHRGLCGSQWGILDVTRAAQLFMKEAQRESFLAAAPSAGSALLSEGRVEGAKRRITGRCWPLPRARCADRSGCLIAMETTSGDFPLCPLLEVLGFLLPCCLQPCDSENPHPTYLERTEVGGRKQSVMVCRLLPLAYGNGEMQEINPVFNTDIVIIKKLDAICF